MNNPQEQLDAIREMRNMMERSSRFISLSGLSGLAIGTTALLGAGAFYLHLGLSPLKEGLSQRLQNTNVSLNDDTFRFMILDALIVLFISLITGTWMSVKRSRKLDLPVWDMTTKRLLINLMIPLTAGGLFCIIMIQQRILFLLAPITLIFYGLALVNASKYTIDDIRNLGLIQILLGLTGALSPDHSLLCWSIGFGLLHIGYGWLIHNKQEN